MSRCRSTAKINTQDPQLPMIDFQKRVIHFGDDRLLFKIVAKLIMDRVDLGGVDHGRGYPVNDQYVFDSDSIDLDALPPADDNGADAPADDDAPPAEPARVRLSSRFRLYRHPDRYGAP